MKDEESQFSFRELLSTLVPAGVLSWALAMLTASYMGYAKIDAAFIGADFFGRDFKPECRAHALDAGHTNFSAHKLNEFFGNR